MKKIIMSAMVLAMLLVSIGGCFVPVERDGRGGRDHDSGGGHDRDGGHDKDRGPDRDRGDGGRH